MDRFVHSLVETSRGRRLPRAAVRRPRREDPVSGYDDLLRSTAVDAFVVTDTYLGNPQAAWLEERRVPFVAFGRPWDDPGRRSRRGSTWTGPPAIALATEHLLERGPRRGSPGSAGARTPGSARTGAPAGAARCATATCPTTGLASRVEDTVTSGREAAAVLLDEAAADRVRLRLGHPGHGRAARPVPTAVCGPAGTSRSWASTTPRSPR